MESTKQVPAYDAQQSAANSAVYMRPMSITDWAMEFAFRLSIGMAMRLITAPFDRVALLTTAEGELKRHGRLPARHGFYGITGCIRRIASKEGWDSFFRGYLADAISGDVCSILDVLVRGTIGRIFTSCVSLERRDSVKFVPAVIITLLLNFIETCITSLYSTPRRIFLNSYIADIVAPFYASWKSPSVIKTTSSATNQSRSTLQTNSSANVNKDNNVSSSNNTKQAIAQGESSETHSAEEQNIVEEGYFYANFSEAVKSVLSRCKQITTSTPNHSGILHNLENGYILEPLRQALHFSWSLFTLYIASGPLQAVPVWLTWNALALTEVVLLHPIDVIKARLDVDASCSSSSNEYIPTTSIENSVHTSGSSETTYTELNKSKVSYTQPPRYNGAWDCAQEIVHNEGISSLFAGLRFRLLLAGISIAASTSIRYLIGEEELRQ